MTNVKGQMTNECQKSNAKGETTVVRGPLIMPARTGCRYAEIALIRNP